jgi:hypothetical protein
MASMGIDLCDRTGLPMYFEASPTSVGLYEKMGYERLNETIVHKAELLGTKEDVTVPLMVRMPKTAGGMSFYEWKEKGYPRFTEIKKPSGSGPGPAAEAKREPRVPSWGELFRILLAKLGLGRFLSRGT